MADPGQVEDLKNLGATTAEIAVHADNLEELHFVRTIWPGERRYTMADAALTLGVEVGDIIDIRVAAGFPEPLPTTRVATDDDLEFYKAIIEAREIFGDEQIMQLVRVVGVAAARIADAATSTYLVQLGQEIEDAPEAIALLVPELTKVTETLLRKHLVATRRKREYTTSSGQYETAPLAVGFADLAGSTRLADRLTFGQIADLLSQFEETASTIVTRHGGRVVKLIGDEILFSADDPRQAARMAWAIAQGVRDIPDLPSVRVGVAAGEVLRRDGDVFGPPVNRAARLVKATAPGKVYVTPVIRMAAQDDFTFSLAGTTTLPGFSTPSELWQIDEPTRRIEPEPDPVDIE